MGVPRPYQRGLLVTVLAYHQRVDGKGCMCGWNPLGASYAEHVANIYEAALGGPEKGQ